MSIFSRLALASLVLACVTQGCMWPDAPSVGQDEASEATPRAAQEQQPAPSAGLIESRDRAAEDAADTAQELDGDELSRGLHAAGVSTASCSGEPLGGFDYCGPDCQCSVNEGDCDSDADCADGLACMRDTGALFGFDPEVDMCMERCTPDALGTPDFCSPECPCEFGQGDCDRDSDCAAGGTCAKNVGAAFGFAPDVDVCVDACDPILNGTFDYCSSSCLCEAGQGDCDSDSDCAPGHVCAENVGADYGFPDNMDVCEAVETPQERFSGKLLDENGRALAGATVSVNQVSAVSDEQGYFDITVDISPDSRYVLNAEKFGHVPHSSIYTGAGVTDAAITVRKAQMISLAPETTDFEDRAGTRIALSAPMQDVLVDANGEPPKGLVLAQMHTFDIVEEGMFGDMEAVTTDGNLVALLSVGAVSVDFVDLEGNEYQLRPGASAQIALEVPPEVDYSGPIPLWHYDEEQGRWVEEGEGMVQDGMAFATVYHFSAYNFDAKVERPSCIKITTTGGNIGDQFNARIEVQTPPNENQQVFRNSRIVTLDHGLNNALFNLPNNTDVKIFVPPSASEPIVPAVNSGAPWGGTGSPLPNDIDKCNGSVILPELKGTIAGIARLQDLTKHQGIIIQVLDSKDDGAEIFASGTSNDEGRYVIPDIPPRGLPYTVKISQPGYASFYFSISVQGGAVSHLACVELLAGDIAEPKDKFTQEDLDVINDKINEGTDDPNDPADYDNDGDVDLDDFQIAQDNIDKDPLELTNVQCPSGDVTKVIAGFSHTCAVMSDGGRVRCWGGSTLGQLGYGNTFSIGDDETLISSPDTSVSNAEISFAAGALHSCVLISEGTEKNVHCWGDNSNGQLGRDDKENIGATQPAATTTLKVALSLDGDSVEKVVAGAYHTCALTVNGAVYCWGDNSYGQLGCGHFDDIGDGTIPVSSLTPVPVGEAVQDITAGGFHTCVTAQDSSGVKCWGYNQFGQLGYGHAENISTPQEEVFTPIASSAAKVISISAGFYHTCVVLDTLQAKCWGAGSNGQLGRGADTTNFGDESDEQLASLAELNLGANIGDLKDSVELRAGGFHTCARVNQSIKCWGRANHGQVGYGATSDVLAPPDNFVDLDDAPVKTLALGLNHSCVVLKTGNVTCWGRSNLGQLGYGNVSNIGDDEPPASAGTIPFLD